MYKNCSLYGDKYSIARPVFKTDNEINYANLKNIIFLYLPFFIFFERIISTSAEVFFSNYVLIYDTSKKENWCKSYSSTYGVHLLWLTLLLE